MARLVMKFGGTSMAGIERIRHVAGLVKREAEAGNQLAVVVSAMAGETDRLVQLCREALPLGQADQLFLRGRRRHLGEPDGVVGGQESLGVARAVHPDPVLGHGSSQLLPGFGLNGFTVPGPGARRMAATQAGTNLRCAAAAASVPTRLAPRATIHATGPIGLRAK